MVKRLAAVVIVCGAAACVRAADRKPIEIGPRDKFLWSCYMICFGIGRDFSRQFYDRPLDRPGLGDAPPRLVDLRNAMAAGFDALSVDLFIKDRNALLAFQQLVDLVDKHRLPIGLSPMFDGFGRPGVTVDDVVAKVRAWFQKFGREPCVVRCDGKPILLTYAAYALSPNQWRTILSKLHDAGCDGYWIADFGRYFVLGPAPKFDEVRPWVGLFRGLNSFPPMTAQRTADVLKRYRAARPNGVWVGATRIGYWRPEVAVYLPPRGTRTFRESWETIVSNGINWVQQVTWNDFSENTHVMPSENYSTTFAELNRYLARRWKGLPDELAGPRFYLSQRAEVAVGETAAFELLALLRPEDAPARFELSLKDAAGNVLKRFDPVQAPASGVQAVEFSWPAASMPEGRLLFPEARLRAGGRGACLTIRGPYAVVTPGGYRPERNCSWLYTPAHRQIEGVQCEFRLDGKRKYFIEQAETTGRAWFRVDSKLPLADVEVLHNGVQIRSLLRSEGHAALRSPVERRVQLRLNRRKALDWGAYAARAVARDGRIATSRPVFVLRPREADVTVGLWTFDNDTGADVFDSSPWLHDGRLGGRPRYKPHRPRYVPDPWGGKCLSFDGIDDRVLLEGPIAPSNRFTVECWVNWRGFRGDKRGSQLVFATANAVVVLCINKHGALQANRHSGGRWQGTQDRERFPRGEWRHVAATCDGRTLRLFRNGVCVGETKVFEKKRCGQVSIGYNSVTYGGFFNGLIDEVRLSAEPLDSDRFGPHNPKRRIPGAVE